MFFKHGNSAEFTGTNLPLFFKKRKARFMLEKRFSFVKSEMFWKKMTKFTMETHSTLERQSTVRPLRAKFAPTTNLQAQIDTEPQHPGIATISYFILFIFLHTWLPTSPQPSPDDSLPAVWWRQSLFSVFRK